MDKRCWRGGRYPGTGPGGEWGEGRKKLVFPRRDRLYRSSSSVSRCVRVSAVIVCVFSQQAACVTIAGRWHRDDVSKTFPQPRPGCTTPKPVEGWSTTRTKVKYGPSLLTLVSHTSRLYIVETFFSLIKWMIILLTDTAIHSNYFFIFENCTSPIT